MGLKRDNVVNKLKPIDKNFKLESAPKEVVEEVIEEPIKIPPEPIDEVTEVSDEEVVVEDIAEEDKSKELEKLLKEEENKSDEEKKVICLDTLDVYENSKDAESKTIAKASAITRCCNRNCKKAILALQELNLSYHHLQNFESINYYMYLLKY